MSDTSVPHLNMVIMVFVVKTTESKLELSNTLPDIWPYKLSDGVTCEYRVTANNPSDTKVPSTLKQQVYKRKRPNHNHLTLKILDNNSAF